MSTKKGSFLKGLIFKEEDKPIEQAPQGGNVVQTNTTPASISTMPNLSVQGVADNKFIEILEQAIEANNLPGQDYFEFKQAIQNMNSIISDEKTKFLTAFVVFKQQGCDKIKLIESADHYIQVIATEKQNFNKELNDNFEERVKLKLDQVEKCKQELEALTKKIAELNTNILQLSQEAQQAEMEIKAKEANFNASADIISSQIIGDKDKINQYLQ